jgi:BolA protein
MGAIEQKIQEKLQAAFAPVELKLINESHKHAHHNGAKGVPSTGETHFFVVMKTAAFDGVSRLDRQRQVNALLADEFAAGVHALRMKLSGTAD